RQASLGDRLVHAMRERLSRAANQLSLASRGLDTMSPLATLIRGFAIVTLASDRALVTDAAALAPGAEVDTRLARGSFRAKVLRISAKHRP
ncbi:MAG: exodeoxyribonuclease VII large subunit, partial [Steroidobacteraceae bacterium]